jgi:hypothetical protein
MNTKPSTDNIKQFIQMFAPMDAVYIADELSIKSTRRLCNSLSLAMPGLGSLWSDYCTYLQSTQPRPDLN